MRKDFFKNKRILVTGGTGSFGHHIVSRLISFEPSEIIIFSRDEKKQDYMKKEFEEFKDILRFVLGDIRDYERIKEASKKIDFLYKGAAFKQIPACEDNPMEAVKTNIIGAENVRRAAIENEVKIVVAISTDKAVKPVNVMGMSKAIQERIYLSSENISTNGTKFICVRYGNVIGSRGSVIPYFRERINQNKPLPLTSKEMTRFLLSLSEAIDLVFYATQNGESGDLFVKKMPACYIKDLARVMSKIIVGKEDYPIEEIGVRPGEKIHEILISEEEMRRAVEKDIYYIIYPHIKKDVVFNENGKEYASNNTKILNEEEIIALLKKENWI